MGNRAATRMPLRDPKRPSLPSGPRVPKTYQVADRDLPRVAADPELAERALQFRVENEMLTDDAFGQNVAVVKYERSGTVGYLVRANDPGELHSEIEAVNELERLDAGWQRTQILEVYTERHPCANCWPNLRGVRERIKRIRVQQGKPATDFRTYYSVRRDEPGRTRATELRKQYFSSGPPRTPEQPPAKVTATQPAPPPRAPKETRPGSSAPSESTPEPARPAEPAPHPSEPASNVGEHERARAGGVEERAKDQGYVPRGDRGGLLDRLGDLLYDPFGDGERSVPMSAA